MSAKSSEISVAELRKRALNALEWELAKSATWMPKKRGLVLVDLGISAEETSLLEKILAQISRWNVLVESKSPSETLSAPEFAFVFDFRSDSQSGSKVQFAYPLSKLMSDSSQKKELWRVIQALT